MDLGNVIAILTGTVLVNNIVLTQFMGMQPFMEESRALAASLRMGALVTLVLTAAAAIAAPWYQAVLAPHDLAVLAAPSLALIMAILVGLARLLIGRLAPVRGAGVNGLLALVTVNSVVLGAALLSLPQPGGAAAAALRGFGYGAGYSLVLVIMAGIRERLETADVPRHLQGMPIALITAGILALAFMGFAAR